MNKMDQTTSKLSQKRKELQELRKARTLQIWYVRFMAVLLVAFFWFALFFPLRPSRSESENRDLTPFPRFSFSSLFSGEFFDQISVWYADTFPLRDHFISLNTLVSGAYGQNDIRIHGNLTKGDEIPEIAEAPTDENAVSSQIDSPEGAAVSEEGATGGETPSQTPPEAPPQPTAQTLGALLINGDTAYEYYNFVLSISDEYIATVNRAAALLQGKATVYDMIIPTSMGITAPEDLTATIQTSDQKKAIEYMYGGMTPDVKKIELYDLLKSHRDEYIYFRTDHHWTALGAYYAYAEWMRVKGVSPLPLTAYIEYAFPGYLGSFYNSSKKLPQLAANPDTVYAYQPPSTNSAVICHKTTGQWITTQIISDMSASSSKYLTFIKGDHPFTDICNPQKDDGSVCLIIKESFGNALSPFPVENYQHLYVLDYRYFANYDPRGLVQFCEESAGTSMDVIFVNNISATRNQSLMNSLSNFVR